MNNQPQNPIQPDVNPKKKLPNPLDEPTLPNPLEEKNLPNPLSEPELPKEETK